MCYNDNCRTVVANRSNGVISFCGDPLEKRLALRIPTVSHFVDLMVHCYGRAQLFVDYVAWFLYRYEAIR